MIEIPLTQGQVARIDDGDFDLVSPFLWFAKKGVNTFYATTNLPLPNGKQTAISMHQVIMGDPPDGHTIDHADRDGLNNCRDNLRFATGAQQRHNTAIAKNNTSGFKGVNWHGGSWRARLTVNKRQVYLGSYRDPSQAARAYDAKAIELFGPFAHLNFPA